MGERTEEASTLVPDGGPSRSTVGGFCGVVLMEVGVLGVHPLTLCQDDTVDRTGGYPEEGVSLIIRKLPFTFTELRYNVSPSC